MGPSEHELNMVPTSLKKWFVVHCAIDLSFAIPLILFPELILKFLGWSVVDPIATRLVGAALVGIGVESFLGRNAPLESFHTMLRLKLLWSSFAIIGIALSIAQNHTVPVFSWVILALFIGFWYLWFYYKKRLQKVLR